AVRGRVGVRKRLWSRVDGSRFTVLEGGCAVMRRLLAPLVLALAATPLVAQQAAGQDSTPPRPPPPKVDFSRLRFMAGCWEGRLDRETVIEEIWTAPAENLLLATT